MISKQTNGSQSNDLVIISRREAKRLGQPRYFTGKPCKNGYCSARRTLDAKCQCKECSAEKNARGRAYFSKNRQSLLEYNKAHREANREARLARKKEHYRENSSHLVEVARRYRVNNKHRISASRRSRPDIVAAMAAKRRALKKNRIPGWFGEFDSLVISEATKLSVLRLQATGISWHVDHMIPLCGKTASGFHCGMNLQVIPGFLNMQKRNRLIMCEPDQWILELKKMAA